MVSIWGSCLKLLWVACTFCLLHLYLYLFWWGSCLRVTLVSISICASSFALACSIPVGYVHKICIMCLHVQFPEDMCKNFNLYRICACIFNSWRICAQVLCSSFLTCMGFRVCMFNSHRICAWLLYCMGSMLSYSIPVGYVHDFMCSDLLDYFWMKDPLGMINVRDIFYVNWLILWQNALYL